MVRSVLSAIAALLLVLWAGPVSGQEAPPLPQNDGRPRMGVASCASTACHNAAAATWPDGRVLQNEYRTWNNQDPHAEAFSVLRTEASARIIANLGGSDAGWSAATEEPRCLTCHADYTGGVSEASDAGAQTPRNRLADGVGCEACHGGSGSAAGRPGWFEQHLNGYATSAELVANGLYPTWDPVHRATLCLSCHVGDGPSRWVTHAMMGAGHPRMGFELDTYTVTEPQHYRVDADYVTRKADIPHIQVWAVGQARQAAAWLAALNDEARLMVADQGVFGQVEWVNFDCQTCHTPQTITDWRRRPGVDRPGLPHLHEANLRMLILATAALGMGESEALAQAVTRLQASVRQDLGTLRATAAELRTVLVGADGAGGLSQALLTRAWSADDAKALMAAVVGADTATYADFATAEQATMALGSFAAQLGQAEQLSGALEPLYDATRRGAAYRADTFRQALCLFAGQAGVQAPAGCGA